MQRLLLLLILLLPACLFAQTASLPLLTGTWVNERPGGGVSQVIVRQDGVGIDQDAHRLSRESAVAYPLGHDGSSFGIRRLQPM